MPHLSLLLPPDPLPMPPIGHTQRESYPGIKGALTRLSLPVHTAGQRWADNGWEQRQTNGQQAVQEEPVLKGTAIPAAGAALGGRGSAGRALRLFTRPCQVFTRYGKCYTFNSGRDGRPPLKTMKGGTGNGLEIMLDIQQDEYLPVWGETGMSPSGAPPHGSRPRPLPGGSRALLPSSQHLPISFSHAT